MCEQFLKLVQLRRIQHAKVVPTMLSRLLSLPPETRSRYDISSLTHLIHSAAPCPPAVKRAAIDWFGPALWELYGCSESGPITSINATDWLEHPGYVGSPSHGAAVVIAADDDTELPAGQTACVFIKRADYWPDFIYLNQPPPAPGHDHRGRPRPRWVPLPDRPHRRRHHHRRREHLRRRNQGRCQRPPPGRRMSRSSESPTPATWASG
ncbi:AMP-binding protein [Nocardia tengchongensis]|uniref:AMP-binding protein n=1 Tax=Nocardia tengchongensis TaxID=2055889 RepID=UPI001FEBAD92|nr:AMP-binding protein [Nocardia tengchongensis]